MPAIIDQQQPAGDETDIIAYEVLNGVAWITMQRPRYANAQNSEMTYALDRAFNKACSDDNVRCLVLKGSGNNFSGGHDIGSPGRDADEPQSFRQTLWWDHSDKDGAETDYVREQEVYLGMCRRWRDMPKPIVAAVQGRCIAGGLALAWICDLIVATEDASFADPVLAMGVPGVEYFAHPHELPPRIAREFLFLGKPMSAQRAYQLGMVNLVVPNDKLDLEVEAICQRLVGLPRFGMALAKQAFNYAEDQMGKRATMDGVFHMHHLAHAHNRLTTGSTIGGQNARSMRDRDSDS